MWAWNLFLVMSTVLAFLAAVVQIVRGRRNVSLALLGIVALLTLATGKLMVDNARVSARNDALTDVQSRAQDLLRVLSNRDVGVLDTAFNSVGENRGVVVAVSDFLLDFKECRPEAYERLSLVFDQATTDAADLPAYDSSLPADAADIWATAAHTAFEQLRAIAEVSPRCG